MKRFLFIAVIMVFGVSDTFAEDLEAISVESDEGMNNGEIDLVLSGGASPFNFSWTGPGGFTSTDEDLFGLAPGVYTVTVTDAWCGVASLDVVVEEKDEIGVGIDEELDEFPLSVYPNPTSGIVYLKSDLKIDVIVFNIMGEAIYQSRATSSIDLSSQPTGVYMLQVSSTEGTVTRKVTLL